MSIISALAGNFGSSLLKNAGKLVDEAFTSDEERLEIEKEVKKAELDYKIREQALEVQDRQNYLKDRQSAREEQRKVQTSSEAPWLAKNIQPIIALLTVCATFMLIFLILRIEGEMGSVKSNIIFTILGAVGGITTAVISFYFGSSSDMGFNLKNRKR